MKLFVSLDAKDLLILEVLQQDGRIAFSELGRRVGLSQPAMSERVKRLEDRGVITGYGARISAGAVGLGMMAIVRLKTTHEHIRACVKQFAALPHVIEVHRVTGDDCFILKVMVPGPGDLANIIDTIGRFGMITTSVVLGSEPAKLIGRGAHALVKAQPTGKARSRRR